MNMDNKTYEYVEGEHKMNCTKCGVALEEAICKECGANHKNLFNLYTFFVIRLL